MTLLRVEYASGAFGTLWFAWQWATLRREGIDDTSDARDALLEVEAILGHRRRRCVMFMHNGLSAKRPFER